MSKKLSLWTRSLISLYTQIDVDLPHDFPTYCRNMFFSHLEEILNGKGFIWEYIKPVHSTNWKIEIKVYQNLDIDTFTKLITFNSKDPTSPSDYQIVFRFPGQKYNILIFDWSYSGFYKKVRLPRSWNRTIVESLSLWSKTLFGTVNFFRFRYDYEMINTCGFNLDEIKEWLTNSLLRHGMNVLFLDNHINDYFFTSPNLCCNFLVVNKRCTLEEISSSLSNSGRYERQGDRFSGNYETRGIWIWFNEVDDDLSSTSDYGFYYNREN